MKSNALKTFYAIALGLILSMFAGMASAALPASIATSLDAVETDALALFDLAWPVVLSVFGGGLLFKLFKRAGNKI